MKAARQDRPKQQTSQELRDELLGFLQRKFYQGDGVAFAKDRRRLLDWVVLWPACWLNERAVTVTADRYRSIFMAVLMEAVIHGSEKVRYRPAWLRQVIQSHFAVHGDEYYEEAKSVRNLVENAVLMAGRSVVAAPDPVRELATAKALLTPPKRGVKPVAKEQLSLL